MSREGSDRGSDEEGVELDKSEISNLEEIVFDEDRGVEPDWHQWFFGCEDPIVTYNREVKEINGWYLKAGEALDKEIEERKKQQLRSVPTLPQQAWAHKKKNKK